MASEMQIKVGADVKDALTGMAALAKEVKLTDTAFEKAFKNISDSVDTNVAAALADTQKLHKGIKTIQDQFQAFGGLKKFIPPEIPENFRRLSTSVDQTAASVGKLTPKIGGANTTLINFGRVVQDAPFGIIGIANNIDPLIQSFQQLKASTGSASLAFKALGSSLLGPAGIGIAVSTITSLLVVFAQRKQGAAKATDELKEAEDGYTQSLAKEKVQLDNLFAITTNANVPLLARKEALKELRQNYGAYLKDLSDEEILAGKAAAQYNLLAAALVSVARARAAEKKQEALQTKILDNEEKIAKLREKTQKNAAAEQGDIGVVGGEAIIRAGTKERNVSKILKEARRETELIRKENQAYTEEITRLSDVIIKNQVAPLKEVKTTTTNTNKEVEKTGILLKDQLTSRSKISEITAADLKKLSEINSLLDLQKQKIDTLSKGGNAGGLNALGSDFLGGDALAALDGGPIAKLNEQAETLSNTINNGINGGIDQFFNALANNQDPFEALKQSVKRLVVELTAAVVKMLILKTIANAIAPGVGGVAVDGASSLSKGLLRGNDITLQLSRLAG